MKRIIHIIIISMSLFSLSSANVVKLGGEYTSNPELSMKWLLTNENSILWVNGRVDPKRTESYRGVIFTKPLLVHKWTKGGLEVIAGNSFDHKSKRPWTKIDETTYTMTVPKKTNTSNEVKYLIKIIDQDNYYMEISGKGNKTREFYTKKPMKLENKSQ